MKAASGAPSKAINKWRLIDLIKISADPNVALLSKQRINTFDQVLRDFRNLIHPDKEKRSEHSCTEAEAMMAKGALDAVCDHLEQLLSPSSVSP